MANVNRVVIAFGRFNPPTVGHAKLVDFVTAQARRLGADAIIFPSQTEKERKKNPKNPLPFREKVGFLRQFFPRMTFNENERIVTIFDALHMVSRQYDNVYMVVGSDRVEAFGMLRKYIVPTGKKGGSDIVLKHFEIVAVPGERDPDADDVSGMSASKMRAAAVAGDWKAFQSGVPTKNAALAKQLYQSVRRHMGLNESRYQPDVFLCYGYTPEQTDSLAVYAGVDVASPSDLRTWSSRLRNIIEMCDPFVCNVGGLSFPEIRRFHRMVETLGYTPTIYIHSGGPQTMTETRLAEITTRGTIQTELGRDVVMLESVRVTLAHMSALLREADGAPPAVKQPSEVDRMKDQQKQQMVLTKQRQAQELLQAKQRELAKKSRDDMNKIKTGDKPRSITR